MPFLRSALGAGSCSHFELPVGKKKKKKAFKSLTDHVQSPWPTWPAFQHWLPKSGKNTAARVPPPWDTLFKLIDLHASDSLPVLETSQENRKERNATLKANEYAWSLLRKNPRGPPYPGKSPTDGPSLTTLDAVGRMCGWTDNLIFNWKNKNGFNAVQGRQIACSTFCSWLWMPISGFP